MKFKKLACFIASVAAIGAVAVPLTACKPDNGGVDENGNVTAITMWVGGNEWSGRNLQNLQNFINEYNKVKPDGFKVTLSRKDDLEKSFQTSRTGGKQPDLML